MTETSRARAEQDRAFGFETRQLHAGQLGIFGGMMTAERALADDGGTQQTGFELGRLKHRGIPVNTDLYEP